MKRNNCVKALHHSRELLEIFGGNGIVDECVSFGITWSWEKLGRWLSMNYSSTGTTSADTLPTCMWPTPTKA
jgi:hypothetical protein